MSKPNILFIFADQMRSTAMGCAGIENVYTPHLDQLAIEGTRFTNGIANTPSCAPMRASLMTGHHTISHGVYNNELQVRLDTSTFAGTLTEAGFKCGMIGKWHIDGGSRHQFTPPGKRRLGFDDYWAVANCTHSYMDSFYYENNNPDPIFIKGYEPIHQANLACQFIEEKSKSDDPFFLVWAPGTPHDPFLEQPQKNLDQYPINEIEFMDSNSCYVPQEINRAKREILSGYYAHITALDEQIGRVLKKLNDCQLSENTIIIFSADHGDMLGNKGAYFKSQPWRESTGVPLIFKWPGHIPENRITDSPFSLIEMMPSVLSLVGVDIPSDTQGDDLSELILGDETAAPDSVYINFAPNVHVIPEPPFRGVITRTHTYAETLEGPWLLYDNIKDPFQKTNLISWKNASDPQIIKLQLEYHSKVKYWLDRTNDAFEDGDVINDKYQPGHIGGVLPQQKNENFIQKRSEFNLRNKVSKPEV